MSAAQSSLSVDLGAAELASREPKEQLCRQSTHRVTHRRTVAMPDLTVTVAATFHEHRPP